MVDPLADTAGVLPDEYIVGALKTALVESNPLEREYWLRKSFLPEK